MKSLPSTKKRIDETSQAHPTDPPTCAEEQQEDEAGSGHLGDEELPHRGRAEELSSNGPLVHGTEDADVDEGHEEQQHGQSSPASRQDLEPVLPLIVDLSPGKLALLHEYRNLEDAPEPREVRGVPEDNHRLGASQRAAQVEDSLPLHELVVLADAGLGEAGFRLENAR